MGKTISLTRPTFVGKVISLLFLSGGSMVGLMTTSSKRAYAMPRSAAPRAPAPAAGHCWVVPSQETLTEKSGSVSCGITAPFSWVLVHTNFCLYPPRVYFLVLCKFWQVYGGVNGDLLQEGLCHTQVCCSQSPCPCGRPLLTRTSTGDTQTQFWLSLLMPNSDLSWRK